MTAQVPKAGEHPSLSHALAALQAELPIVRKKSKADVKSDKGNYSYTYADLAAVSEAVLPLLGKHGLSFSGQPTLVGEQFVLQYQLEHTSGQSKEGIFPLPDPTRAKPQEVGSWITYARRYCLCASTGVATEDDDDDAKAAGGTAPAAAKKPADPKPPISHKDWAAQIVDVTTEADLRKVYALAEDAGELGYRFATDQRKFVDEAARMRQLNKPPADVTVVQLINAVGGALSREEQNKAEGKPTREAGWPTVDIPKDDEEKDNG